ncbi:hypothetical protein Hanom_Chr04g00383561 [Helianthus anomalus]
MNKMDPVPVPNLPNRVPFRYRLLTFSVPVRYGTGIYRFLPSNTGTEPYRTGYIRYRYPLLRIFGTSTFGFGTVLIPTTYGDIDDCGNVAVVVGNDNSCERGNDIN